MIKVTVEVSGKTHAEIVDALQAALKSIQSGRTEGFDRNGDARYYFETEDGGEADQ
ncbi:hypothetical protein [Micromonospora sp. NPDC005652]|uniref:hypothetical protein n=1 Tax=Micromonospora sp. NPDC005652 TaxID=3157046 RepID=UPI0033E86766